ncbi:MAG: efflux RND transporter periplasmic adaptor subunit [Phycisphaerae bacterium]|nr:efflux RND transporter periplasmic adaptor subunit [Phycisphaerae bacterium]
MKTIIGIVILGIIVGGIYYLNDLTRSEDGKSLLNVARELELLVETTQPEEREIIRTVQAPGEVEAIAEVDISSEIVAKILEMPVEEGDQVRKGDLLCRLDDADYRARVLSAKANVARLEAAIRQAEANVEKAQLDYNQERRLIELGATSADTVSQYRTILVGARAGLEMRKQELVAAKAAQQSAEEDLEKTVITAPLGGVISQRFAKQGEVVVTGTMNNLGTRIMVVSDLSKMQVRCKVDEADAPLAATGQPARIYLQSDTRRSIPGRVLRVGTKGTKPHGRDVVTFETLVLITGPDERVKPGMTANVEIEVARKENAVTIPVEAVVYRRRRDLPEELVKQHDAKRAAEDPEAEQNVAEYIRLVFCIEDGKAHPHLVQTGINDATRVEITAGITLEDTVVTGPYRSLDQLKDGSAIKVEEKPEAEAKEEDSADADEGAGDAEEGVGDAEEGAGEGESADGGDAAAATTRPSDETENDSDQEE